MKLNRVHDDAASIIPVEPTSDLLALHASNPERYPYLLQSTSGDGKLGRYDILFALPGESLSLDASGHLDGPHASGQRGFVEALDAWFAAEQPGDTELLPTSEIPFCGGWFLYLGYELAGEIETSLSLQADERLPVAFARRCRAAIVRDCSSGATVVIIEPGQDSDTELRRMRGDLLQSAWTETAVELAAIEEEAPLIFTDAVRAAKEHIRAGDIYQANLSREWRGRLANGTDPAAVFAALRRANPAPFAGIVRHGASSVVSSSPERLLKIRDGIVSTRPIAGTRPRSEDAGIDDGLSAELFSHPKERAEHIMLIDLERNDLGRISKPGTVFVDEMMVLESYAHVHHIVSNVRGELLDGVTPGQAIRASFPGGTITGCPKVRCMEIVADLEATPRGAYTGSFGYLNRDGSLDLNILIRTMVLHGDEFSLRAGAGIVADSDPDAELEETRAKAKGMLRALGA